jgi:hypothetical protein
MKFDDSEATLKVIIKNQLLTIEVEGFGEALKVANGMENNLAMWVEVVEEFTKQKSTIQ